MKIVNIIGGLGNQMFQYALAKSLETKFGDAVLVDTSLFDTYNVHNGLEIERVFNLKLHRANECDIRQLTRYTRHYSLWRIYRRILPHKKTVCKERQDGSFDESVLSLDISRYYDGYWQNYRYFESCEREIRRLYSFQPFKDTKNIQTAEKIQSFEHSISIHIRRGDYLKNSIYKGICTISYYKSAIQFIKQHINSPCHFFVFSDDIDWCRTNLNQLLNNDSYSYVDWNKEKNSYLDMQLMSLCRHNIIANSSFSWWAAWLNQHNNNIIVAPYKWQQSNYNNHIQMPQWILM